MVRSKGRVAGWLVMLGVLTATLVASTGQDSTATIHDGVYVEEQAVRGRAHYEATCETCHGANLSGANARELVGEDFLSFWDGLTLDALFERIQSMPPGASSSLGEETYLELLAYILDANRLPSGSNPLRRDRLNDIMIQGEDGPQAAADFSLVQVVGCLARGTSDTWLLTQASEPLRTREPASSTDDALTLAGTLPLGAGSFELLNVYPDPSPFEGHRVEAKGFLIRAPADRINVTGLQSLAPVCAR